MKKSGLFLFVFLCVIAVVKADGHDVESILIARGYTKFYPKERDSHEIYMDTYEEIFNGEFHPSISPPCVYISPPGIYVRPGVSTISLVIPDDFSYRLHYIREKEWKKWPNILSVVFISTDEGTVGFYKKNLSLTGVKVQTVIGDLTGTGFETDQLVFY
jgi:hypothetical protein